MKIMIGSARSDERGKYSGGTAGDQKQISSTNDTKGEVSMQELYVHPLGWLILRPISMIHAGLIACKMITACNNVNLGYNQGNRLGVVTYGVSTKTKTECDCSSLARQCVKEATGKDPGNFTTDNAATMLEATGLFEKRQAYVSQSATPVYNGDILVTKTKGHMVIVTNGNPRITAPQSAEYYPKYIGTSDSIVSALSAVGEKDTSKANRAKIAAANNIANYNFTAAQNIQMVNLLKAGTLKRACTDTSTSSENTTYYPKYTGSSVSIVTALNAIGVNSSYEYRKNIASRNNIAGYRGTAEQNIYMLNLLKNGTLKRV